MDIQQNMLQPLGYVRNGIYIEHPALQIDWDSVHSTVLLFKQFEDALEGLDDFSHATIVFYMHKIRQEERAAEQVLPNGFGNISPKGVFATRRPQRPNPIGVSVVKILYKNENSLEVQGLNAFHNTPVLDIRPYTGHKRELVLDFTVPHWSKVNRVQ